MGAGRAGRGRRSHRRERPSLPGHQPFPIDGARVLLTGASSGIGAQLAVDLAFRGARLVLVARRAGALEEVAAACTLAGGAAVVKPCDLADLDAARAVAREAVEHHEGLDLLVNNAGIPCRVHSSRLDMEQVEWTMRVNYLGSIAVTLAVLPTLLEQDLGHVLTVSSLAGRVPAPREAAYVASKHALSAFMDTLAVDLSGTGVDVSLVSPAVVETPLWDVPGQEETPYRGTAVSADECSRIVLDALEHGRRYETFVPRRFSSVARLRAVMAERFLARVAAYDRKQTGRVPPGRS